MTVSIENALNNPTHARMLHDGISLPFSVVDANTTNVSSNSFAKSNVENQLTSDRYKADSSTWTIEISLDEGSQTVDCICIGGDGFFSGANTISIEFDDGGFVEIDSVVPTLDSAIMFFFDPRTTSLLRVKGTGTVQPEIYNIMVGSSLEFPVPFYQDFTPARGNRDSQIYGNVSRRGELMGRSLIRSHLKVSYSWRHLTDAWVRANVYGPNKIMESLEVAPFYIAWRPADKMDVDFVMVGRASPPQNTGPSAFMAFSISGEAYAHE